ncbi:MAG: TROVE domain-containing protein [Verrucomicrobiae bacterium]|nr:TROVE domain-containing protein [Verrucomicrobiae bacterium]
MKFNQLLKRKLRKPDKVNLAGGQAHTQSEKLELVTILLTSFLEDQFYRKADATAARLRELVAKIADKRFVAKAALYARREAGMRSVSHLVAADLARSVKGEAWTKDFFDRVVHRADDTLEILACYLALHGKPLPNSLKKGLGRALARFDAYQLAKYRREGGALKLVDAVNLVHPPHTEALARLVDGSLAPAETWETRLTQAGQAAESESDKAALKAEAWRQLIRKRKIGYFALLRNLRNVLEQAPDLVDDAVALLTDESLIRRSLVMPFRFRVALDAIEGARPSFRQSMAPAFAKAMGQEPVTDTEEDLPQKLVRALSAAADRSLANVPRFDGRTLVAVDCSGSMIGKPMKIASLFAAVLYKANRADLMLFDNDARYTTFNRDDATLSIAQRIEEKAAWAGTNFHAIFQRADRPYDRVVILSDMQAWIGHHTPAETFKRFIAKTGKRPRVFTFDLAGYGSLQFPEPEVYALAGFSDKTMETLRFLEADKSALIREIERIAL